MYPSNDAIVSLQFLIAALWLSFGVRPTNGKSYDFKSTISKLTSFRFLLFALSKTQLATVSPFRPSLTEAIIIPIFKLIMINLLLCYVFYWTYDITKSKYIQILCFLDIYLCVK